MVKRVLPFVLAAVALALFVSVPALAQKGSDKDLAGNTHEGKVVSASGHKLVMTDKDGKEHTHTLAPNARISCDGKMCKLDDLKPGQKIRVTTERGNKEVAVKIEALDKDKDFPRTGASDKTGTSK